MAFLVAHRLLLRVVNYNHVHGALLPVQFEAKLLFERALPGRNGIAIGFGLHFDIEIVSAWEAGLVDRMPANSYISQ